MSSCTDTAVKSPFRRPSDGTAVHVHSVHGRMEFALRTHVHSVHGVRPCGRAAEEQTNYFFPPFFLSSAFLFLSFLLPHKPHIPHTTLSQNQSLAFSSASSLKQSNKQLNMVSPTLPCSSSGSLAIPAFSTTPVRLVSWHELRHERGRQPRGTQTLAGSGLTGSFGRPI